MSGGSEVGRVVWHDLLTNDVAEARRFYAELLGWKYEIEHASDFTWKPGEADYPLIFANGEAHGGFVDPGQGVPSHWIAFVLVENVDAATAKAEVLGATIDREPFDVPGVGRSAVIRGPQGAIICPYVPTHHFPPPSGAFLWDELLTDDIEPAKTFYGELFGWEAADVDIGRMGSYTVFRCADGTVVAGAMKRPFGAAGTAAWVTYLATADVDATIAKAKKLGAGVHMEGTTVPSVGRFALLEDSTGAMFGLLARSEPNEP